MLWMKLVALGLSLVLAAVAAEVLVLALAGQQAKFPRHVVEAPWGLRYNNPGSSYRHQSADGTWQFRINSGGMRDDREFTYAQPAGVQRIVSLGDSFTVGYEVDVEQCFSSVLEHELRAADYNVEVLNAGVSGFSTAEECLYLERELWKYEPDVVLVSFYGNDLVDNTRTSLFRFEEDTLDPWNETYVPMGAVANYLNSSFVFNLLSERSNAMVFLKEQLTTLIKHRIVTANEQQLAQAGDATDAEARYRERLAAAIFERIYEMCRERGVPLVIQSIPGLVERPDVELVEQFPLADFDVSRPGVTFVSAKPLLDPNCGGELLYHRRSHGHWTVLSHGISGRALARAILDADLLHAEAAVASASRSVR